LIGYVFLPDQEVEEVVNRKTTQKSRDNFDPDGAM
jgi:hypothetical protein